ncbi:hypothetical protein D8I24_4538 [Cupriavidus necator H850]|nr:hypothetical protein D8I24_4538 [Cupriavidus necator H850]
MPNRVQAGKPSTARRSGSIVHMAKKFALARGLPLYAGR